MSNHLQDPTHAISGLSESEIILHGVPHEIEIEHQTADTALTA